MKHLKLYEEYIPFLTNKKEIRIIKFILDKLEEIYNRDEEYEVDKWPNGINYFKIDNQNILLEIKTYYGGPGLGDLDVKFCFFEEPPEIDPLVEEEWDEDTIVELKLPFSFKIFRMIKKFMKKKRNIERNRDLDAVINKI
jgi:hypothetical protein